MYVHSQQNLLKDSTEIWKFTIDTEATESGAKTTSVPFNLYNQNNVILDVDWGDGTRSALTPENYTTIDFSASIHEYAEAGQYQITIRSASWKNTAILYYNGDITESHYLRDVLYYFRRTLISIDSILPEISPNTRYIDNFQSNTIGFCYIFYGCNKLQSIPSGLFDKNSAVTSFNHCFAGCSSLTSIPSGLFDKNTAATDFSSCFYSCSSLASIPSRLFYKNTAATDFYCCFRSCISLAFIPSELFSSNTAATDFSHCFAGCSSLTSIPSRLFSSNTAATTFISCFSGCTSLASIPSGLFSNCTTAANFSGCFSECTSLASIPSGLFSSNTAATTFNDCFKNCSALEFIPSGLFDNCTEATSFYSCFQSCSSMQSIPSGLFGKNTKVTSFADCFNNCSNLKNFKLIIGSERVSNFGGFIPTASNVTRIVCVPANSTTYTTVSNYAQTGSFTNNITVSTTNLNCVQTLEYTVNTEANTANAAAATIPIDKLQNASSKLLIDWGDGNGVELIPANVTTANLTHTYSSAGEYQITVGTTNWLDYQFLSDSSTSSSNTLIQTFRETVVSIDEAIPPVSNATLDYWFYHCMYLESYSSHIFDNLPNVTSAIGTFKNCTSLAVISAGTLRKQEALTNATEMFSECTLIEYIPSGLLSQCRQLTIIDRMFYNCTNLSYIPEMLLFNNLSITSQVNAFDGSDSTSSPMFITKSLAESFGYHVELYDTEATQDGDSKIGIPYNLNGINSSYYLSVYWGDGSNVSLKSSNYPSVNDSTASVHQYSNPGLYFVGIFSYYWSVIHPFYYYDEIEDDTYNTVAPLYWRRRTLIEVSTAIPSDHFSEIYYYNNLTSNSSLGSNSNAAIQYYHYCKKLKIIPNNLFVYSTVVTDFSECFCGCSSLQSIPSGLFDSNTAVTNFSSCFCDCISLQSIPEGLFDKNTAVTDFSLCFTDCISLQSIPSGLFDSNTAVTNFHNCFSFCTSLQSIPSGLFDSNTAVTDFSYCFNRCTSLQSIPSGLFDNNVAVTDFNWCFQNCSSLQSIPSGLFDSNTAVTSFSYCFYNCSTLTDFTLHIGSSSVSSCSSFVTKKTGTTRTIYVPNNSTTQTTFSNQASTLGLTIIGE